jgi:hypothetical protein
VACLYSPESSLESGDTHDSLLSVGLPNGILSRSTGPERQLEGDDGGAMAGYVAQNILGVLVDG